MSTFGFKAFRSKRQQALYEKTFAGRYAKNFNEKPFLYFGLPFISLMIVAQYGLTEMYQSKIDRDDKKVTQINGEDLEKSLNKRPVNLKEEYYRLQNITEDNNNWEPIRVQRLKGEKDNVLAKD
ncbi:related to Cytochrome c oxidase assembly protein COX16, mitochondrial [Hanseniaspora guilliermondii]|uniref:Cytochrome c oxidase assembly protein COX16, mitochondrial n=1 Tax=Hanseniaspora guilliermondii TaxID=56406 RepID=A0A1L0AVS5_9ASCO|nr:related to Cytochrome c oxidase assembly protein COX16, mitochondrial [Hanseniaspora guilliermondii]